MVFTTGQIVGLLVLCTVVLAVGILLKRLDSMVGTLGESVADETPAPLETSERRHAPHFEQEHAPDRTAVAHRRKHGR
jgi:hypothetical protein